MRVNDNDIEYSSEIVDTKEEVYEVVKEGFVYRMVNQLMPARYRGAKIVTVIIDGKMRGYKIIPKQCGVDPKEFPIYNPALSDEWYELDDIAACIEKTMEINEADIILESYIKDDFSEMKDQIYIRLYLFDKIPDKIPYKEFKIFHIVYEVEIVVDGIRFRVEIDNDMLERWGISVEELDEIAMENSIRDYPPIMRTLEDSATGEYNLLLGDDPDTPDKTYILENPDIFLGASVLAYPDVLENIAEILDDDFLFYAINAAYVMLSASNKNYDGSLAKSQRRINPYVLDEEYFSPFVHEYIRETGEIAM